MEFHEEIVTVRENSVYCRRELWSGNDDCVHSVDSNICLYSSHYSFVLEFFLCVQYMLEMNTICFNDGLDRDDQKGCIQGGVYPCLDERCRRHRPSGPQNTPSRSRRAPTNILVEQGVECGLALHASAALKIVPVANPTTGLSSTKQHGETREKTVRRQGMS